MNIKNSGHRSLYSDYSKKKRKDKMTKKRRKKKKTSKKRSLPPRIKTGPRKGQFRKRKKRRK